MEELLIGMDLVTQSQGAGWAMAHRGHSLSLYCKSQGPL